MKVFLEQKSSHNPMGCFFGTSSLSSGLIYFSRILCFSLSLHHYILILEALRSYITLLCNIRMEVLIQQMSSEMCTVCGLPKELCICEEVAKEQQRIIVKVDTRKYKKEVTVIEGLNPNEINLQELTSYLKSKFACGGTIKDNIIELQGNHKSRMKVVLIQKGFSPEQIKI